LEERKCRHVTLVLKSVCGQRPNPEQVSRWFWVQQVNGGDPVQVTKGLGQNWQPDWSPDGKNIVYRSEDGDGGLFVVPAFGGDGRERRIASFGYHPRWSPDSSQVLFQTQFMPIGFF
jgi:Tol biopolymer transport system component